jgi:cell division protein YceG involved in septum cleavage
MEGNKMKITKEQLKQIIKEEYDSIVDEGMYMDYNKEMERQFADDMEAKARAAQIEQEIASLQAELEQLKGMMYPGQYDVDAADDPMTQEKNRILDRLADLKK